MKQRLLFCLAALFLSGVSLGQAPNLGTTANFALFTAVGAFNNVGASTVRGDIGTNVGAFNGVGIVLEVGQPHVADPTSASAATDVLAAYTELSGDACGKTIDPQLGGQTLTPGVSCQPTATATSLDGILTLDGQGNPNAVFIIKLNSALSTGIGSSINLINGASSANVFFQINGAVGLGAASIFRGTILANGAISLGLAALLDGRGLSTAGAISLATNIVTRPGANALPVALVSFTAKVQPNHTVDISWTTSMETNNKGFMVERSKELNVFETVGEVGEVATNSSALKTYHLIDQLPYQGTSYYRLRQTDLNGKTTLYPAVAVVVRDEVYGVFPNPVLADGRFSLRLDEPQTAAVSFYGVDGHPLLLAKTGVESGNLLLKPVGKLPAGIYMLRVEERGTHRTHRLVIE